MSILIQLFPLVPWDSISNILRKFSWPLKY